MRVSRLALVMTAVSLLAAAPAHSADQPNDGRGQGNPGQVGKPGENKSGSSGKDSARDSTNKSGERGFRDNSPRN